MDTNRYENVIVEGDVWIYIEDYAIEGMEKEVQLDLNKTYKLALQLFNTTAFSWSPDIIDVANAHTIGENFTPSFIPPHTRINRGDIILLDGGNVIEQGPSEEIFVSPTQERTRQFFSRYLPEFTYNI